MATDTQPQVLALVQVPVGPSAPDRAALVTRARLLARIGLAWHVIEAAVAIGAGVAAGSIALVGFGADSLIEAAAGLVVLWLMAADRVVLARAPSARRSSSSPRRSSLLAAYVGVEAVRDLAAGHHPGVSWVGVALSVVTLATMPPLAVAKRRVGERLGSAATTSESRQTMLCAYLSAGLLAGLLANALAGWWWADPVVALGHRRRRRARGARRLARRRLRLLRVSGCTRSHTRHARRSSVGAW